MKTELKDRVLWFDGTSEVSAELVPDLFLLGLKPEQIVVHEKDDDLVLFDSLADEGIQTEKLKNNPLDMTWNVPDACLKMDLESYLKKACPQDERYLQRLKIELDEIKFRGLENLFKTLIFVKDTFKKTGTVWGVGRGSSCASLALYLIGIHKVDPIKFNIPHTEFFHD